MCALSRLAAVRRKGDAKPLPRAYSPTHHFTLHETEPTMTTLTTRTISTAALALSLAVNLALFGAIDTGFAQAPAQSHEPVSATAINVVQLPPVTVRGKRLPADNSPATITDIAITADSAPTALPAPRNAQL